MSKGLLVGYTKEDNDVEAHYFNEDAHILTIAQSGAGKNTSVIMPNLLSDRFNGAKIILDLKGENSAVCSFWREQEAKGKTFRLNPWHIFDIPTIKYNPFCVLDAFGDDFYDECVAFSEAIIPSKKNQSDTGEHFDDLARDFISSLLSYLTIRDYPNVPNPANLYDELMEATSSIEKLKYIISDMESIPHPDPDIIRVLKLSAFTFKGLISTGENNELRGVKTTISRALSSFKSKRLYHTVHSEKEESLNLLESLFQKGQSNDLFISFPQSEIKRAEVWLRLVLTSFIRDNINRPPKNSVLFVLDEFPQLGTFNLIKDNSAFLRGYHVRFWFIGQNIGQFKTNYGEEGMQTIFENCTLKQFFNVSDKTAEYVSKKLGKVSYSDKDLKTMVFKSKLTEYVMTSSEVEQSSDTFIFNGNERCFLARNIPYYNNPENEKRALPNPLFHGLPAFVEERIKLLGE